MQSMSNTIAFVSFKSEHNNLHAFLAFEELKTLKVDYLNIFDDNILASRKNIGFV